jgi:hypothetical protein
LQIRSADFFLDFVHFLKESIAYSLPTEARTGNGVFEERGFSTFPVTLMLKNLDSAMSTWLNTVLLGFKDPPEGFGMLLLQESCNTSLREMYKVQFSAC